MSSMIRRVNEDIEYCVTNPSKDSTRELLCYAALDMGTGHVLRDRRLASNWYATDAQKAVNQVVPQSGTCGLLDTTTVLNGFRILHPDQPIHELPAGAVFDLGTFISACIFEDNLLFLQNSQVSATDVSSLLGGLPVSLLPWGGNDDFSVIVENAWGEAERWTPDLFNDPKWRDGFVEHWSHLMDEPLDLDAAAWPENYRDYFSSVDSFAVKKAIMQPDRDYSYPIASAFGLDKDFVVESSIRAVFYSIIANATDVTYYASSYRTRLRNIIYDATEQTNITDAIKLFDHLNTTFHSDISADDLIKSEVEMPFVISAALAGVSTCSDLCERIIGLRELVRPLRSKRSELALAIRNQDQPMIHALVRAITEDAQLLANSELAAGRNLWSKLILSPGGARPAFGALGKLLLYFSNLPKDVQQVLRRRCVRPELWVITRLSAQARQTINCLPALYDLLKPKGLALGPREIESNLDMLKRLVP